MSPGLRRCFGEAGGCARHDKVNGRDRARPPVTRQQELFLRCRRHIELREEKGVDIGKLFDSLAQGGTDAVSGAGAGAKQNRLRRSVGFVQARSHFARMVRRDPPVIGTSQH